MQQLCLMGTGAAAMALRLFSAIPVRPVGYRLTPFTLAGRDKGQLLHLLMQPARGFENDMPCRLRLSGTRTVVVRETWDELAAPALLRCQNVRAPILLDGLAADVLACPQFRQAVGACLRGERPVVAIVHPDAAQDVRTLLQEDAAWYDVTREDERTLLDRLQEELAMRL